MIINLMTSYLSETLSRISECQGGADDKDLPKYNRKMTISSADTRDMDKQHGSEIM